MANVDIGRDYGRYVLAATKPDAPAVVLAAGPSYQTPTQMCEDLSEGAAGDPYPSLPIAAGG